MVMIGARTPSRTSRSACSSSTLSRRDRPGRSETNASSIVPAVGTAEPNGLLWHEGLSLLRAVCADRTVVGFDVVEVAPVPQSTLSEFTLAKLVYKLIGLVQR